LSQFPGEHRDSNNFKTDFGRSGASSSNLLNDLSEGGKESRSVSACTRKKLLSFCLAKEQVN